MNEMTYDEQLDLEALANCGARFAPSPNVTEILAAEGGNKWEKHGKRRVYFDAETIVAHHVNNTYKTITFAGKTSQRQVTFSKREQSSMNRNLGSSKFYYDLDTREFVTQEKYEGITPWNREIVEKFADHINGLVS